MLRVGVAICSLTAVLACQSAQPEEEAEAFVESEVVRFLDAYNNAIESRDGPALEQMYVDDGRFEWIEEGEVRYRTSAEVLAGLAAFPTGTVISTEYRDRVISQVGDNAARVSTAFRTVVGEGPSAFQFGGMMTLVLERDTAGWRIVSGHTSSKRESPR